MESERSRKKRRQDISFFPKTFLFLKDMMAPIVQKNTVDGVGVYPKTTVRLLLTKQTSTPLMSNQAKHNTPFITFSCFTLISDMFSLAYFQFDSVRFNSVQLLTILLLSRITIYFNSVWFSSIQFSSIQLFYAEKNWPVFWYTI